MAGSGLLHVYCSPTLRGRFADHSGVIFHPPIQRGDLETIASTGQGGAALIIDGVFAGPLAVSGTECRTLMEEGWQLYGCSSIGALRAAELHSVGMIGLGRIYDLLRLNIVTDDAELAAAYHPRSWREMTIALINLRCGLLDDQCLSRFSKHQIWDAARSIFYMERTSEEVLGKLRDSGSTDEGTVTFVKNLSTGPTQKLRDADYAMATLTSKASLDAASYLDH